MSLIAAAGMLAIGCFVRARQAAITYLFVLCESVHERLARLVAYRVYYEVHLTLSARLLKTSAAQVSGTPQHEVRIRRWRGKHWRFIWCLLSD